MSNRFTKGQGLLGSIVTAALRVTGPASAAVTAAGATIADGASMTLTAANVVTDRVLVSTPSVARNVASPTAAAIIAALPLGSLGQAFEFVYINLSGANALTLTAGTNVTITGSATIALSSSASFLVVPTSATAVTIFRK